MRPLLAAVLLLASPVTASAQADYARPGAYVGLGTTIAIATGDTILGPSSSDGHTSAGINLRGGYRFLAHLAAEIQAEWIPSFPNKHRDTVRAGLNVKAPILTGRFQPYLQAGFDAYVIYSSEFSNTDIGVPLGAGLDFYATEKIVLNAGFAYVIHTDWIDVGRGTDTEPNRDYVAVLLGLQYRF